MKVCSKCGLPDNGMGVCANCGSTSFITIGNPSVNYGDTQLIRNAGAPNPAYRPNQIGRVPVPLANGGNGPSTAAAVAAGVAIGSKSVAKIVLPIVGALIALVLAIVIPLVVSSSKTPEHTIEKLETALNEMDLNAAIECFDSEMRDAYAAGDDLFNSFFGFSYQSFADLAPFLSDMLGSEMQQPQYDFEILNKEMLSSKECVLTVRISTYYDSENETVDEGEIPMVKEDGDWYISSDDFSGELGDELFY